MAAERTLYAKEDRRRRLVSPKTSIDIPFLILVLLLLVVGLAMLYSASYAQSEFDTGYADSTRYLKKQAACALIDRLAQALNANVQQQGEPIPCELNRGIEFRNVSFGYTDEKTVLNGISFLFESRFFNLKCNFF